MANLNKVLLIGRLTKDPELRQTPGGQSVCKMRLATDRTWRDRDGAEKKEVLYIDVTVWARQAETCAEYLKKGRPVFIEGRLTFDEWEDKDGQKRSKHEVVAERVQFLDSRGGAEEDDEGGSYGGASAGGGSAGRGGGRYGSRYDDAASSSSGGSGGSSSSGASSASGGSSASSGSGRGNSRYEGGRYGGRDREREPSQANAGNYDDDDVPF